LQVVFADGIYGPPALLSQLFPATSIESVVQLSVPITICVVVWESPPAVSQVPVVVRDWSPKVPVPWSVNLAL
jgi:hypothetical protein